MNEPAEQASERGGVGCIFWVDGGSRRRESVVGWVAGWVVERAGGERAIDGWWVGVCGGG